MKTRFFVISTPINGVLHYAVCRIKDKNQPIIKENLEFASHYTIYLDRMKQLAKGLNLSNGNEDDEPDVMFLNNSTEKSDIGIFLNSDIQNYIIFCNKLGIKPCYANSLRTYYRFKNILKSYQGVQA